MLSRLVAEQVKQDLDDDERQALQAVRKYQLDLLHHHVSGMNLDNFIVRPQRRYVEPFIKRDYWDAIDDNKHAKLETYVSILSGCDSNCEEI